ncbi:dUTP diphosphatase [Cytobacillus sp. FJAT-54145]|uniref:dUTP diphosphatase n=1 Tax=Cytobacillus spartinae TaxID=3299023 RepID=A0ABW6KIU8_9BACI
MNLDKLFKMQKVLRDRINYNEPDRFNKLVLALLVELGECANEWRGFKFWSVNQVPHTSAVRVPAMMDEDKVFYNPLLEEYVDGLHFVLELGIELDYKNPLYIPIGIYPKETTDYFIELYYKISELNILQMFHKEEKIVKDSYQEIFDMYLHLGHKLGFTWEQIEQAYMDKNAVNHQRQEDGY